MVQQSLPGNRQQWTPLRLATRQPAPGLHRAQPVHTRPAQGTQQQGLCLVVLVVRGDQRFVLAEVRVEGLEAGFAGRPFQSQARVAPHFHAGHGQAHVQGRALVDAVTGPVIGVRLQAVVHMDGAQARLAYGGKSSEDVQQHGRIQAPAEADQQRQAGRGQCTGGDQRLLGRARHAPLLPAIAPGRAHGYSGPPSLREVPMALFDPLRQRSITLRNRIAVSPMCQYSSVQGMPDDWHRVHLGSRAVGGAALVMTEAVAVSPEARISPADAGLWNAAQAEAWAPIAAFIAAQGAVPAAQLAHAGRKAATAPPWDGGKAVPVDHGGWQPVGPSALAFDRSYHTPLALDDDGIASVVADFRASAQLALEAGFQVVEVHAAHGYLLHQFLSPLSNLRQDRWGGSFENRARLLHTVLAAVREAWPERYPLWLRISATDWADGGWDIEQSVELARGLARLGVDLVDVSSGGLVAGVSIPLQPGYQVPFAARIRHEAGIATGAVGLVTEPAQADAIVRKGEADVVLLARELLRHPYFPLRAAKALGVDIETPRQYARAW